jgi:hypothetical protein
MIGQTASVGFFDPPRPPPERPEPEWRPPPSWLESPRNELGAPVPLRLVLARTDRVAVALVGATAYSTGVTFNLATRWRRGGAIDDADAFYDDPFEFPFGHPTRRRHQRGELPPEILRFGIQFSDERKATTVGWTFPWAGDDEGEEEPSVPVLLQGEGGGSEGEWESEFWLWPLPPPGPVAFVVEWPAREIGLTKHEVDASVFIEASTRSEVLWPEEDAQNLANPSSTFRSFTATRTERCKADESDA